MGTSTKPITAQDGTPMEKPMMKENVGYEMPDRDYLVDLLRRYQPTREQVLSNTIAAELSKPVSEYVGDIDDLGTSRFDSRITRPEQLENLENTRAYMQTGVGKIAASIPKMATLAATTFVDGTLGTIAGLGNVMASAVNGDISGDHKWRKGVDAFIHNPVSEALQHINDVSENVFKNYYTDIEQNRKWYQNIFTANFLGDTIIKNAGFVIGAAYSGKMWSSGLSKTLGMAEARDVFKGITQELGEVAAGKSPSEVLKLLEKGTAALNDEKTIALLKNSAKKLRNGTIAMKAVGGLTSAIGEARIEALNGADEFEQSFGDLEQLRQEAYQQTVDRAIANPDERQWFDYVDGKLVCVDPEGQRILQQRFLDVDGRFNSMKRQIEEMKQRTGNTIFALNLPLLMFSNIVEFGKMMAGDFSTERIAAKGIREASTKNSKNATAKNAIDKLANTTFEAPSRATRTGRMARAMAQNSLVEGAEEMNQSWISSLAKYKGTDDSAEFVERLYDPEAQVRTSSWLDAFTQGFKESWGNVDDYVEGFSGAVMGFLGLPSIGIRTNGKKGLVMNGGFWDTRREEIMRRQMEDEMVGKLNSRLASPEFKAYYYGMIGHNSAEGGMEAAIATGDKSTYDKYSHMQLINDLVMFDTVGRLDEFKDMINSFDGEDINEGTIQDIKTTINDEAITKMDSASLRKQINDNINDKNTGIKTRMQDYIDISNDLKVLYGNSLTTEQMQSMIWNTARLKDLNRQIDALLQQLAPALNDYRQSINIKENATTETTKTPEETDLEALTSDKFYNYISKLQKDETNTTIKKQLTWLRELNDSRKNYVNNLAKLSNDPELVERRMQTIDNERANDKAQQSKKAVAKDIKETVTKYGDMEEKYMDEEGSLTKDAKEALRKQSKKGDPTQDYLLKADSANTSIKNKLQSLIDNGTINKDFANSVWQAWREHISEAENAEQIYMAYDNPGNKYGDDVVSFLNNLISEQEQDDDRNTPEPSVMDSESLAGHKFYRINIKDDDEVFNNMGDTLDAGTYYFDITNEKNIEAYTATGDYIGSVFQTNTGANLRVADILNNLQHKAMGVVNPINPVLPWEEGWEESQSKKKTEAPKVTSKPANSPINYNLGEKVYDKTTGEEGRVWQVTSDKVLVNFGDGTNRIMRTYTTKNIDNLTHVQTPPVSPIEEQAKDLKEDYPAENIMSDDKGTSDDKNMFLRPFNIVADRVKKLRVGNKIRFAVTGKTDVDVIELWHNDEKVGELPTDPAVIAKYKGMKELIDMLHKQFDSLAPDETTGMRFATMSGKPMTTTIRKVYTGAALYGDTELPLSQIPNIPKHPIFIKLLPIPKKGNDKGFRSSQPIPEGMPIVGYSKLRDDIGATYMLIPDGFERLLPVRMFQRKVNGSDFNLNSQEAKTSPIAQEILKNIIALVDAYKQNNMQAFDNAADKLVEGREDNEKKTFGKAAKMLGQPKNRSKGTYYFYFTHDKKPMNVSFNVKNKKIFISYYQNGEKIHESKGIDNVNDFINELQTPEYAPIFNISFIKNEKQDLLNEVDREDFADNVVKSDILSANLKDFNLSEPGFNMDYYVADNKGGHFEEAQAGVTESNSAAPNDTDAENLITPQSEKNDKEDKKETDKEKETEVKDKHDESDFIADGLAEDAADAIDIPETVPEGIGFTQEEWNTMTPAEKEQALRCRT